MLLILSVEWFALQVRPQDVPNNLQQQLENQTDLEQGETEDDSYVLELEQFRKNPINLNVTDANELKQLRVLTGLQIESFLSYRNLLGRLINIYELQAIPAWDLSTIRKILPYIKVDPTERLSVLAEHRFKGGEHDLLLRVSQVLERSKGFSTSSPATKFLGSPQRLFLRYRYAYKNLLQFGITGDKDAGEQFFRGAQRKGFDFYSFHFFTRNIGNIKAIAVGDFTVNFGQGLIQWQGLAFKKSADVMNIKRQSAALRPYTSSGEFNFNRGAGITFSKSKWELTGFLSFRKLSANFVADTVSNEEFVSSFLPSGYHRTENENLDKNVLTQSNIGGSLSYTANRWHVGLNGIYYRFSTPVQKRDEPYNLYAVSGSAWSNFSIDYSFTYRNFHFFGEAAADRNVDKAFVNGLLVSVDPRVDISILHRAIPAGYQSISGNAFTENTFPTNESGIYIGTTIRPASPWRVDLYADFFRFPWLKFQVDAPSHGSDFLAQLTFIPNKQVEVNTRFRREIKQMNQSNNPGPANLLESIPRKNWRIHWSYALSRAFTLRNRVELNWYDRGPKRENGFMSFVDMLYKPTSTPFSATVRLQYFETDSYNSRIYAYENDVLYSYSIPALFDKGYRYYIMVQYDPARKLSVWLRWSQTIFPGKSTVGSDLDEIQGNKRSELKVQFRWII